METLNTNKLLTAYYIITYFNKKSSKRRKFFLTGKIPQLPGVHFVQLQEDLSYATAFYFGKSFPAAKENAYRRRV